MRILIALLCGVIVLYPLEVRAGEAALKIKATIISFEDWQRMLDGEPIAIASLDDKKDPRTMPNAPVYARLDGNASYGNNYFINAAQRTLYVADDPIDSQDGFMIMDINNDNVITEREYLISTGTPVTKSNFDDYDLDGDGLLSRFEVSPRFN